VRGEKGARDGFTPRWYTGRVTAACQCMARERGGKGNEEGEAGSLPGRGLCDGCMARERGGMGKEEGEAGSLPVGTCYSCMARERGGEGEEEGEAGFLPGGMQVV
jgi:hypothetical protein